MISDEEYIERIVAGVHAVTSDGAEVTWNEVINGRQFDVVVRFRLGTLKYIVLIEVKNRSRKATAEDLDAFVNKSKDQQANKAVFVTAAGFQSGAIDVAKRHGIDLFTVTFDKSTFSFPKNPAMVAIQRGSAPTAGPVEVEIGAPELMGIIDNVTLTYADGVKRPLPTERTQMTYYVDKTRAQDGRSLEELIRERPIPPVELGERREERIRFRPMIAIKPPDEYFISAGRIKEISYSVAGQTGHVIKGSVRFDPGFITYPVVYTNVITGESEQFNANELPLGLSDVAPGLFYCLENPLRYYYCERIDGDLVYWVLVESFQSAELLQARFSQKIEWAKHMIPVSDTKTIARLMARYTHLRRRPDYGD